MIKKDIAVGDVVYWWQDLHGNCMFDVKELTLKKGHIIKITDRGALILNSGEIFFTHFLYETAQEAIADIYSHLKTIEKKEA